MTIWIVTKTDTSDYYSPTEVEAAFSTEEAAEKYAEESAKGASPYKAQWAVKSVTLDEHMGKISRPAWWARVNSKSRKVTKGAKGGHFEIAPPDRQGYWLPGNGDAHTFISFVSLDHAVEACESLLS